MTRVMTGESTVILNLTHSDAQLRAAMDARWRNRLAAAEGAGLQVQRVGANPAQYAWLMEEELKQRLSRGFSGLPLGWINQYIHARKHVSKTALILRADAAGERAAAMLFLIHGQAATYQVGWSSDVGRDLNAHNLLLWQAMQELRQRGVRRLDLGGVNTERSAGLARFKIGSGGEVLTLSGTYM
jgi:lipid II:glycine glycyltransferase (peptidoglycan interpeptide bridge formation enzyme)